MKKATVVYAITYQANIEFPEDLDPDSFDFEDYVQDLITLGKLTSEEIDREVLEVI